MCHHRAVEAEARPVRRAQPADAAGIGLVHVRSWQAAYRGLIPQDFLDHLDPAKRAEGWRQYLDGGPRAREALLVSDGETGVDGFALVGPSRDEDGADDPGEVYAFYVLPQRWRRGVGRQLMAAALDALGGLGFGEATLWVLEGNDRGRRFYEAVGWRADGATKTEAPQGFSITEVRYRYRIR